jgi:RHS repeat-associated protein
LVRDPESVVTRLLAKWNGANPSSALWRYYSQDNIGSTRMGTNDGKATIKTYDYTPYGEVYFESGWAHTNFRFTGAFWDSTTQMYYFPFRQYRPSVGRWISRDPLGVLEEIGSWTGAGMDSPDAALTGPNLYAYVEGNPIRHVDPEGRELVSATVVVVGIGIVVVVGAGHGIRCAVVYRRFARHREKLRKEAERKYPIPKFLQGDCSNVPSGTLEKQMIFDERQDYVTRKIVKSKQFNAVIRYCGFEPAYSITAWK